MYKRARILGRRGGWTAEVEGRELAVLHNSIWQRSRPYYRDSYDPKCLGGKEYMRLTAALRTHDAVVIQHDVSASDLTRDGYVGVFRFQDLAITDAGEISLLVTERLG